MRNLRLLLLIAAVAALGSYSALAVAGSAPAPGIGTGGVGSQATNEAAGGPQSVRQQQPEGDDAQGADKIAQTIANEFGVSKDEVLARHNEGIGFGALFKLYKLARAQGIGIDELLASVPADANGERDFAFGQRIKALTGEQRASYDSGPKNLGRLISAASKNAAAPEAEGEPSSGAPNGGANSAGRAPGNGHVPPGLAKKNAGP
jgi:hypothetical protein